MYNNLSYFVEEINQSILISKYNIKSYFALLHIKGSDIVVNFKTHRVANCVAAYLFLFFLSGRSKIRIINKNKRFYRRRSLFKKKINNLGYLLKVSLTKKQTFELLEFIFLNSSFDLKKNKNDFVVTNLWQQKQITLEFNFKNILYFSKFLLKLNTVLFENLNRMRFFLILKHPNNVDAKIKLDILSLLKINNSGY